MRLLISILLIVPFCTNAQLLTLEELDTCKVFTSLKEALKAPDIVYRLKLKGDKLESIPKEVFQLKNLQELNLKRNDLKEVPEEISQLENLQILNLVNNTFTSFPKEVTKLKNLKKLYLGSNMIPEIPDEIVALQKLEFLDMYSNPIEKISVKMSQMEGLKTLDLRVIQFPQKQQYYWHKTLPNVDIKFSNDCGCG